MNKEDRKAFICQLINIYFGNESIAGKANLEHLNDREKRLEEALKKINELLDEKIGFIPCEASVYTLTDDEFGMIMHCRDLACEALK